MPPHAAAPPSSPMFASSLSLSLCSHCLISPAVVPSSSLGFCCGVCFVSLFTQSIRQSVRRHCVDQWGVRSSLAGARIAVGWSGGMYSSVLCHLFHHYHTREEGKHQLRMKDMIIIHVDNESLRQQNEFNIDTHKSIHTEGERFECPVHVFPLSSVFELPNDWSSPSLSFFSTDVNDRQHYDHQLKQLFSAVSASLCSTLETHLIRLLLAYTALCLGVDYCLLGSSSTLTAVNVMHALVRGQGGARCSRAVHHCDTRLGTRWLLPLQETEQRDIAYYYHYTQLAHIHIPYAYQQIHIQKSKTNKTRSVHGSSTGSTALSSVCSSFITGLQQTSRSHQAVTAIIKTIQKVRSKQPDECLSTETASGECAWCGYDVLVAGSVYCSMCNGSELVDIPAAFLPRCVQSRVGIFYPSRVGCLDAESEKQRMRVLHAASAAGNQDGESPVAVATSDDEESVCGTMYGT